MTRPGIEPATSRSQSGRSTTEPLCRLAGQGLKDNTHHEFPCVFYGVWMDIQPDPTLCWSHRSYCRFCCALVHLIHEKKCTLLHSQVKHAKINSEDILAQGLTNPLPSCPGQVQILAGQVIFYFTCPEKCIEYIRNIVIPSYFQAAVDCRASG